MFIKSKANTCLYNRNKKKRINFLFLYLVCMDANNYQSESNLRCGFDSNSKNTSGPFQKLREQRAEAKCLPRSLILLRLKI